MANHWSSYLFNSFHIFFILFSSCFPSGFVKADTEAELHYGDFDCLEVRWARWAPQIADQWAYGNLRRSHLCQPKSLDIEVKSCDASETSWSNERIERRGGLHLYLSGHFRWPATGLQPINVAHGRHNQWAIGLGPSLQLRHVLPAPPASIPACGPVRPALEVDGRGPKPTSPASRDRISW